MVSEVADDPLHTGYDCVLIVGVLHDVIQSSLAAVGVGGE